MLLARDYPELFVEIVHMREMKRLPLGSKVFDPCQHPEQHCDVCTCPRGCLTWELERCVVNKMHFFHMIDCYEYSYLSDDWRSFWQPSSDEPGKYLSVRLLYQLADVYSDVPNQKGCTEMWRVLFPYTVYAMMYGLWMFPVMALAQPTRLDQFNICFNLQRALDFVEQHSNYGIEAFVAGFMHVWWFKPELLYYTSEKYVLNMFKWSRRVRLQLRVIKSSRRGAAVRNA